MFFVYNQVKEVITVILKAELFLLLKLYKSNSKKSFTCPNNILFYDTRISKNYTKIIYCK